MLAEQLITIANKTPKACEILNKSKKLLSGSVLFASDVNEIQHNIPCQLTSDTITDFSSVKVSRYGENLLDINKIEAYHQENVSIDGDTITVAPSSNNKLYGLDMDFARSLIKPGVTYTFSIESTDYVGTIQGWRLKFADGTYSTINYTTTLTITPTQKVTSIRFIFDMGYEYTDTFTVVGPQIKVGSSTTPYAQYIEPQTITANADGTVEGITSVASNMTILADGDVNINCQYYPQGAPLRVFKEISSALLSAKEEVIK